MSSSQSLREYRAMIWTADPTVPGRRVTVWATSLDDARQLLEKEHGAGNVFNLYNPEDADKPR